MLRNFTDRVFGGNHDVWGGSGEVGVIVPIIPKWLDFQVSGVSGNGNARYGAADQSVPDVRLQLDGRFDADPRAPGHDRPHGASHARDGRLCLRRRRIHERQLWLRELSQDSRRSLLQGLYSYGYGNPAYVNAGCNFEGAAEQQPWAHSRLRRQHEGRPPAHRAASGIISMTAPPAKCASARNIPTRSGTRSRASAAPFKGTENMIFTSLRYYPFN